MKRIVVTVTCGLGLVVAGGQFALGNTVGKPAMDQGIISQLPGSPEHYTQVQQPPGVPTYESIAAIFDKYHCTLCHGGADPKQGLKLDSYADVMKGSKNGPVVVPGDPGKSELIKRVKGLKEPRMPLTGPPWLTDDEVATLERWIAAGVPQQ